MPWSKSVVWNSNAKGEGTEKDPNRIYERLREQQRWNSSGYTRNGTTLQYHR
jgi:hypothetical protein